MVGTRGREFKSRRAQMDFLFEKCAYKQALKSAKPIAKCWDVPLTNPLDIRI